MQSKFENEFDIPRKFSVVSPVTSSNIHYAYDISNDIRKGELTDIDAIKQSIRNILTTIPGERLFNITFGSRLWNLIFNSNITSLTEQEVISVLINDINKWEDRVSINTNSVKVIVDYDNKSVDITVPFTIKNTYISDTYNETLYR